MGCSLSRPVPFHSVRLDILISLLNHLHAQSPFPLSLSSFSFLPPNPSSPKKRLLTNSLLFLPLSGPEATYGLLGKDLALFSQAGFDMEKIHLKRNAPVAQLYEDAIKYEGAVLASSGALINFSGKKTGRSPKDKRIVFEETSKDDIWVSAGLFGRSVGRGLIFFFFFSFFLFFVLFGDDDGFSGDRLTSRWTNILLRSTERGLLTSSTRERTSTSLMDLPECVLLFFLPSLLFLLLPAFVRY